MWLVARKKKGSGVGYTEKIGRQEIVIEEGT